MNTALINFKDDSIQHDYKVFINSENNSNSNSLLINRNFSNSILLNKTCNNIDQANYVLPRSEYSTPCLDNKLNPNQSNNAGNAGFSMCNFFDKSNTNLHRNLSNLT